MGVFIFLNLTVGLTAYLWASRYFSENNDNRTDFIFSFAALFLAQVVISGIILGFFQRLSLFNLGAINIFFLVVSWLFLRNKQAAYFSSNNPGIPRNYFVIFSLSIVWGFVLVKVLINLFNPAFGWDSLNYHFTFPVEWLKHGNLINPPTINDDPTPTYYPLNGCLIYLWLIFPFKSVFLADLGQLPFYILSLLSIYRISLRLNLKPETAFYAAAAFAIIPNFLKQLEVGYADIMAAGLFFLSLNFLIQLHEDTRLKNLMLFGISTGLLLGIKTVALTWTIILATFLFAYLFISYFMKRINIQHLVIYLVIFLVMLILFGGYGYLRNYIQTGNPLYPFKFELGGKTIFNGVMASQTYQAHWGKQDYNLIKLLFHEGMGIQLAFLFFPGIFLGLWTAWFRKPKNNFLFSYLAILPFILYLSFRYLTPQLWTRFLYPFLGSASLVTFYGLERLNFSPKALRVIIVVIMLSCAAELSGHAELIFSLILTALIFIFFLKVWPILNSKKIPPIIKISGIIFIIAFFKFAQGYHDRNEFSNYIKRSSYWPAATGAWAWLNLHTQGNRIAYVGRPVPFPLYGEGFKNDVYYVSVNEKEPLLHNFKHGHFDWDRNYINLHKNMEEAGNYRANARFDIWWNNLAKKKTEFLFVYTLHETEIFPIEDTWASGHTAQFEPVFANSMVHIYHINAL